MDNLELYNKFRTVPKEAKKPIEGGRLKGMTDINPMWRIKILTEQFGPCGIGWYPKIINKHIEEGANGEKVAIVDIELYYKQNGEWSMPIPGTGGSSFIAKEKAGLYTNDECYKMAYTDALSIACKPLGIGADVYYEKDRTKYDISSEQQKTIDYKVLLAEKLKEKGIFESFAKEYGLNTKTTQQEAKKLLEQLEKEGK